MNWLKKNLGIALVFLVVAFFFFGFLVQVRKDTKGEFGQAFPSRGSEPIATYDEERVSLPRPPEEGPFVEPVDNSQQRIVLQETSLSIVVSDVRQSVDDILNYTRGIGGFMVNSNIRRPDDSASATLVLRLPTPNLEDALNQFRNYAVKVTNENISGRDVTSSYIDIQERIATLQRTKERYTELLDSATDINDILEINRNLIYVQEQIDSYIAQRQDIENNQEYSKVTIYLSTDELSLPYTPDDKFRPQVTIKTAIRGLLSSLQSIAEYAIWASVYSVIWLPALGLVWFFWRRMKKKTSN